jgi:predicted nuclease with TOPRIM domain
MKTIQHIRGIEKIRSLRQKKVRSIPLHQKSIKIETYLIEKEKERILKEKERLERKLEAINQRLLQIDKEAEYLLSSWNVEMDNFKKNFSLEPKNSVESRKWKTKTLKY